MTSKNARKLEVVQKSTKFFDVVAHRLFALPVADEFGHCRCNLVAIEEAKLHREGRRKDGEEEEDVHQRRRSGCYMFEFLGGVD